jgi:hypothetical protein
MFVEVFKTNVQHAAQANMLAMKIRKINEAYIANFDLQDCDRILRVKSLDESVESFIIISLLSAFGFKANVLDDNVNSNSMSSIFRNTEKLKKQKFNFMDIDSNELSKALSCEINEN